MADYNTFILVDCISRKPIVVTSSARKASKELRSGIRIEVWNNGTLVERIYEADRQRQENPLIPYINAEREYIRKKQERATKRNHKRKATRV